MTSEPLNNNADAQHEHDHSHTVAGGHSYSGSGGHSHNHAATLRLENKNSMLLVLGLTSGYMLLEVCTGYLTGSLALLADAGHMFGDVAGLILALLALWFASKPATSGKTFGYFRSEILASFLNGLALVCVSLFILYESYLRLAHPPKVEAPTVLGVAVVGLFVNILSLRILQKAAANSLNAKAAYLEILGDSLASVGVIVSSLVIIFFGWNYADPLISGIIAVAILPRTWALLKECTNILMEGTPVHVDLNSLRQKLMTIEGVIDVHDIHVWTITSGRDAMSGHVTISDKSDSHTILTKVSQIVNDDFGIEHSTIQVENLKCATIPSQPCDNNL